MAAFCMLTFFTVTQILSSLVSTRTATVRCFHKKLNTPERENHDFTELHKYSHITNIIIIISYNERHENTRFFSPNKCFFIISQTIMSSVFLITLTQYNYIP